MLVEVASVVVVVCQYAAAVLLLCVAAVVVKAVLTALEHRAAYKAYEAYWGPPVDFPLGNALVRKRWHGRSLDIHVENLNAHCSPDRPCYKILAPSFCKNVCGLGTELVCKNISFFFICSFFIDITYFSTHFQITKDPRVVKHVLSDHFDVWAKSNNNGRLYKPLVDWFGQGIFTNDHGPYAEAPRDGGKMWHAQRQAAATIFTRELFKHHYETVFTARTAKLVATLQAAGGDVDLQEHFFALSMDCFGSIAYGADMDNDANKTFGAAFDRAQLLALRHIVHNIKGFLLRELLPSFLGTLAEKFIEYRCPLRNELETHIATTKKFTEKVIAHRKDQMAEGEATKGDLLSLFLRMEEAEVMRGVELRDALLHFILAGRDTTASLLSFLFFRLGNPENKAVLDAVIAEVDAVFGGETPTLADLDSLPYLRGAVWETLRLHPVVPVVTVTAKAEDRLPDGVVVPKGTRMLICNYAMGRDASRYGEDVLEFKPERWIPFTQPSPYEFPVFKAGRRTCLGKDMALFESTKVAATLLQKFIPESVNPDAYKVGTKLTMVVHDKEAGVDRLLMKMTPR